MKGTVYLVGGGPGDWELLTIKAERLIKSADVIVFDRLVEPEILKLAKPSAVFKDVGKNVGNHIVGQDRINQILVELANKYEVIVRLKGGDPYVFGRGGEEACELKKCGVKFEVVPGITSSIAVATYAGIPVTHRDCASSFHVITGHAKAGKELDINFKALVEAGGTLVFMMSVANIKQIANGLICAGMNCETPCAVIENGTRANQRKLISDVENVAKEVEANKIKSPAIFLVGGVVNYSERLDWFSIKPLKGVKVLSTQKEQSGSKLVKRLKDMGAEITCLPTIETISTNPSNIEISKYTHIAFFSAQGVESFFEYLEKNNKDTRVLAGKIISCVGSQTASVLKLHGITADFMPKIYSAANMAEGMIKCEMLKPQDNVLLARAKSGSVEIIDVLKNNNIKFDDVAFYDTKYISQDSVEDMKDFDYITFTSQSGVESFVKSQPKTEYNKAVAVCIGKQTASCAKSHGFNVVISKEATINSMVEKILQMQAKKG